MATGSPENAHLRFALAMHRATAESGGNACFSPYSVASALGLVTRAARGATAEEPAALLAGSIDGVGDQSDLLRKAAELEARQGQDEPVLTVANTLWTYDKLPLEAGFLGELATWPGGNAKPAPFVDDPEQARSLINADVSRETRDLIPELLPRGSVGADTVAAIVNALYLRVGWVFPFAASDTTDGDFRAGAGMRRVTMMRQSERLGYAAHAGWQVVSLPAVGGVEAVVLLPDASLAEAEVGLTDGALEELLAARSTHLVTLTMPRLSLNVRLELTRALQAVGVRTMFSRGEADFGALSPDPRLYVSGVEHQAVLRLDEAGIEGAAATAATMRVVSMPGSPVTVEVDRPFLLLVRHAGTGAVYFVARVAQP